MKQILVYSAYFILIGACALAQTTPLNAPGGAVTVQPGTGTVQPQVPTTAGPLPSGNVGIATPNSNEPVPALTISGFRRFEDPTLNSYIQLGLERSPNLKAALSRLEEARIRVQVAQSFLSPSLRSSALITTQSLSERRPLSVPNQADLLPRFQLNTFQLLPIDASYELDLFK